MIFSLVYNKIWLNIHYQCIFKAVINQLTYLQIMSNERTYIATFLFLDLILHLWKSFLDHPINDAMLSWSVVMRALITIVIYFMTQVLQCNNKKATEAWLGILLHCQTTRATLIPGAPRRFNFQHGPAEDFVVM